MENLENIANIGNIDDNIAEQNAAQEEITSQTAEAVEATATEQPRSLSDDPEVARLIAEAEERGYIRGRNDKIEQTVMRIDDEPGYQSVDDGCDSCPSFLSHIRPSFWSEF